MWTKTFASQTNVLHWCADMETLFVGLDNGAIHQLFIPKEYNYMRYQEVSDSLWIMIISTVRMKPCIHIQSE